MRIKTINQDHYNATRTRFNFFQIILFFFRNSTFKISRRTRCAATHPLENPGLFTIVVNSVTTTTRLLFTLDMINSVTAGFVADRVRLPPLGSWWQLRGRHEDPTGLLFLFSYFIIYYTWGIHIRTLGFRDCRGNRLLFLDVFFVDSTGSSSRSLYWSDLLSRLTRV